MLPSVLILLWRLWEPFAGHDLERWLLHAAGPWGVYVLYTVPPVSALLAFALLWSMQR